MAEYHHGKMWTIPSARALSARNSAHADDLVDMVDGAEGEDDEVEMGDLRPSSGSGSGFGSRRPLNVAAASDDVALSGSASGSGSVTALVSPVRAQSVVEADAGQRAGVRCTPTDAWRCRRWQLSPPQRQQSGGLPRSPLSPIIRWARTQTLSGVPADAVHIAESGVHAWPEPACRTATMGPLHYAGSLLARSIPAMIDADRH